MSHDDLVRLIEEPGIPLAERMRLVEQRIIEAALIRNYDRKKDTAADLGISRVTLYKKCCVHDLC